MSKHLLKALPELEEQGILSEEVARNIRNYYQSQTENRPNRLFAIFGIFGALLVGLGFILIIGHNWDSFSTTSKLIISFIPLIIGQGAVFYALKKHPDSQAWKESSGTFLFFAVGGTLSLISQIYNLSGPPSDFVFYWLLLTLPLMYLLPSSMVALFYLIGTTYLGINWMDYHGSLYWPYWIMLLAFLPHYFLQQNGQHSKNFRMFNHFLLPISISILVFTTLGNLDPTSFTYQVLAIAVMLGIFQGFGAGKWLSSTPKGRNGYFILSTLGISILLILNTFKFFWEETSNSDRAYFFHEMFFSFPGYILIAAITMYAIISIRNYKGGHNKSETLLHMFLPMFVVILLVGLYLPMVALVASNLLVLLLGLASIREGVQKENFAILNYGLLLLAALVTCRFFDSQISFVWRGITFLLLGIGFFVANYIMFKRINSQKSIHEI
ncbi:MAG: DUF2157 domain-containing protein [Bacteroidia bacterium]|nr:DUF2157 domain-containing protein [Bacteroidia bacterium]